MYFLLSFSFLITTSSAASEIWMQARSIKKLYFHIEQAKLKKELKMACLFQIKTKKIPTACYTWLSYQNHSNKTEVQSYLDEKCQESSSKIKNLIKIKKILRNPHLSSSCRKQISQRKTVLEYQLRDGSADKLFQWYLQE